MNEERDPGAEIARAVRELRDTRAGQRLGNRAFRQEHAAEALLRHSDPIMRQIGQQLRDGSIRPSDVLRIPEYSDAFTRAAQDAAEKLDPEKVAAEMTEPAERSTGEERERRSHA